MISPNSTFEIIGFEIFNEYVPEFKFGIILKLNTSPEFPLKVAFEFEYATNLKVLPLITFAAMVWSLALDV